MDNEVEIENTSHHIRLWITPIEITKNNNLMSTV